MLVLGSEPFNPYVGSGVTLSGLFGAWPKEHLADAYEGAAEPDPAYGARTYSLRARPPFPANRAVRQLVLLARVLARTADQNIVFGRPSRRLLRFVEEFRPDALFLELASLSAIDLTLSLAQRCGIPYAVHVPDDWMPRWPMNVIPDPRLAVPGRLLNWRLQQRLPRLIRGASLRLAISESLAGALEERYGTPFGVAYNCVEPADWPVTPMVQQPDGAVRLLYSGSIFRYGQSEALGEIAEAVRDLRAEGLPVHLDIYTQQGGLAEARGRYAAPGAVEVRPLLPREEFQRNLMAADVLLLPTNFDDNSVQFLRYSMPGKMAEYLMAARPVFAYGPSSVEQVRYLRARDAGLVVHEHSPAALRTALRSLVGQRALRDDLARRARAAGEADFALRPMQQRMAGWISEMVRGSA